jgi:hypothetical protein
VDVLVRPDVLRSSAPVADGRAPWETALVAQQSAAASRAPRRVVPTAIPVIGGLPIGGRRLVRAPWAEPLAAFAGVIVETRLVPDEWLRPRTAAQRATDPPLSAAPAVSRPRPIAARPAGPAQRLAPPPAVVAVPLIAVPLSAARPGPVTPAVPIGPAVPARPFALAPATPATTATGRRTIDGLVAIPVTATRTQAISAVAPVRAVPKPDTAPVRPAGRRGFLGRAVMFTVGLVVSLVAFEAAARVGRR